MNAAGAAATARSTSLAASLAAPAATVAYGWLLTGSATSNVSPSTLATRPSPMKWSRVVGSPAGRRAGPVTAHHPYQQHRQHQLSPGSLTRWNIGPVIVIIPD